MAYKNQRNSKIIEDLKRMFGAEPTSSRPNEDDLQFLEERKKLEEMRWRYVDYVENYELIKAYGLDLKLMDRLKWNIVWSLKNNKEEFLNTKFYQKFKSHEKVKWAFAKFNQNEREND